MKRGATPPRRRSLPAYSAAQTLLVTGILLGTLLFGLMALSTPVQVRLLNPVFVGGLGVGIVAGRALHTRGAVVRRVIRSLGETLTDATPGRIAHWVTGQ